MRQLRRRTPAGDVAPIDGLSPLLVRLYGNRGIADSAGADHSLSRLPPPDRMKGLGHAAARLAEALSTDERILIVGDFDADGATSCALLVLGLRAMGALDVDFLVPNRFDYGYGLTPEIVTVAHGRSPGLIVTVDNGIASVEGVDHARALGIDVIVTDHHLPGETLPAATAIVNPNQPGCEFPCKHLAGVGVAFYLLSAIRKRLVDLGAIAAPGPRLADLLDLVALGTIADVVPMDFTNRVLAAEGLRRIRAGRARPGILALLSVAGADYRGAASRDLAFSVAPRLNAAGRLDDMTLGIDCLLAEDSDEAMALASRLDALNRERREIETEMRDQAIALTDGIEAGADAVGVCLFDESWHQGVVGLVASRMKERLHRPVIAFARASDTELKGSARSIAGLHVRDALDAVATRHPGLITRFGGHAMAAGLSLPPAHLAAFTEAFDTEARRWLGPDELEAVIVTDGELEALPSIREVRDLSMAAPWGQGFPEPLFDGEFELLEQRIVGGNHLKLKLRSAGGDVVDGIAFNHRQLAEGRYQRLAYRLDVNDYRGRASVQLIVEAVGVSL